jgi:carboxymethylenebutenolidase
MRTLCFSVIAFLSSSTVIGHTSQFVTPQTVEISSGALRLKAFLWIPHGPGPFPAVLFNHGSGGGDAEHTAGLPIIEAAEKLGPLFVKHGYAFLYLFRRGQGLSADQAPFIQDVLQREERSKGQEARQHLQFILLTTEQLDDVTAALSFLKNAPRVDAHRIAVVGHSFGGQLTLLAVERDNTVRAAITFAAAADSWGRSPELRERLLTAVRQTTAPIMLIQAENDYSTAAGRTLDAELNSLHKPHVLEIYGAVGQTPDDGHNAVYSAIPIWQFDVFRFLDEYVRR